MSEFSTLTHQEITAQLNSAAGSDDIVRRGVQLMSRCSDSDCQEVLQFIESKQLLPAELLMKLRGQPPQDSREALWVEPVGGSEMIWIRPGPFQLGSKYERHVSEGFYLATHPVTNLQFQQFVSATGYCPEDDLAGDFLKHWGKKLSIRLEQHPVTWVSMLDALHYCHWTGLDLPTQWLWEKAARGPSGDRFPWGDETPERTTPLANVCSKRTKPIGKYPKTRSPYGCQDLVGNVSEWCHAGDAANPGAFPARPAIAGCEQLETSAVRGACFLRCNPRRYVAWSPRTLAANRRNQWTGFRVAFFPVANSQ